MLDVGEGAGHEVPEFGGVGLYGQMSQLVDDDVLDMTSGGSIMVRQLNRRVPSGAQLPQRLRWLPMITRDLSPTPSRGHQRSISSAMCSSAQARYHAAKACRMLSWRTSLSRVGRTET